MSIKILLAASRPDQSVDFWWNTDTVEALATKTQTAELFSVLGITETAEYSEDNLTYTRTIVCPSIEVWDAFMAVVITNTDLLAARKEYFNTHGHSLTLTKVDSATEEVFDTIPDAISHLNP